MMDRTQHLLARNTAVQVIGKILSTIFGMVTLALFARHLGTAGFGDFTLALTFLSIFAVLVDFGLTLTTVQMISQEGADEEKLVGNVFTLRVISATVFLALAPIVALAFPYEGAVRIAIAVGAVSFLFGTTAQLFIGIFQKRLIMWQTVVAELFNRTIVMLGAIAAGVLGFGLADIMWILVAGNALQLITMLTLARRQLTIRPQISLAVWKSIILRSWPIGLSIFFNLLYLKGDILFLSIYRTSEEIGLYGAAYKIVDVMTTIPVMYMGIVLPILVYAFTTQNLSNFKTTMQSTFAFFCVVAVPFLFGAIALGVPIMELIGSEEYHDSGLVLAILGPATAIVFFGSLFGHAVVAVGKQKMMTLGYAAVAVITIALYIAFIPRFGIWAAAWITLVSESLIAVITYIVVARTSSYTPKLVILWKALFASFVMFAFLKLVPMHVIPAVLTGSVVYFIALRAVRGIEFKTLLKLFLPSPVV